jgi:hypothetical protein
LHWGNLLQSRQGIPLIAHVQPSAAIVQGAGAFPLSCAKATQCHRAEANYFDCCISCRAKATHCVKAIPLIALRPLMPLRWSCWNHSHYLQPSIASAFAHLASNILQIASTHFGIMELQITLLWL